MTLPPQLQPEDLEALWMPFTANRQFKAHPRLLAKAEGMHYWTADGRKILDGVAGLWCVNAGHGRREIAEAVHRQLATMDYAPPFQMGHPAGVRAREPPRAPDTRVSITCSSPTPAPNPSTRRSRSRSPITACAAKVAAAAHRPREGLSRRRLRRHLRRRHGQQPQVVRPAARRASITCGTRSTSSTTRSRAALPGWGAHLADELERLVALHDASTIAAVIVEPVAGSAGVILPPKGYLQRLRAICDKHGILLIFDEVITGFGRLGAPFGAQEFDVLPDMITAAKGLTNGACRWARCSCASRSTTRSCRGPRTRSSCFTATPTQRIPTACAAALATLYIYQHEGLLTRARELSAAWESALHGLKGLPHIVDLRNYGLIAGIEFAPAPGRPTTRAFDAFLKCFERGLLTRSTGDVLALSPPLIIEKSQIEEIFGTLAEVIRTIE